MLEDGQLIAFNPYFALFLYPFLAHFVGLPTAYAWGVKHGGEPMPPVLALSVERKGRLLWIFRYFVLAGCMFYALHGRAVFHVSPDIVFRSLAAGSALGLLSWSIRLYLWPSRKLLNATRPELRGPVGVWLAIILTGAVAEEAWQAFCIIALHREVGFPVAILETAGIFVISQVGGRPGRLTLSRGEFYFSGLLAVSFGVIFVATRSIIAPVAANLSYHSLMLYSLRNRSNTSTGTRDPLYET